MRRHAVPLALLGLFLMGFSGIPHKGKLSRAQTDSQSSSQPQPGAPQSQPPSVLQSPQAVFCSLWRVDHSFRSTIHIKNSLTAESLEVTPALYMADGAEYDLAPVTLAAAAVADVDVNQALGNAPPEVAAHLSEYGSAALRYPYPSGGVLQGEMTMLDIPRSLVFQQPFIEAKPPATAQTLEGLWWKHDPGVEGFLNLANHTGQEMEVTFQTVGARGTWLPEQSLTLTSHATRMLDLDQLTAGLPGLETQAGGVRVRYTGGLGEVGVGGGLENAHEGYSANMIFWSRDAASSPKAITLAAVGLQAGDPDPAAGFPGGTRFAPYLALRNATSKSVDTTVVLYTASNCSVSAADTPCGQASAFPLPVGPLKPYESRQLDFAESLDQLGLKNLNGSVNLKLSYTGAVGDVVMAAGSTDQTGNYVFEVLPQGVETSLAKEIPYWTVAHGFDTSITLWNSSSGAEDLVATFSFAGGAGQYRLPLRLDVDASLNLDLAALIASQQPDAEGRVIPLGTTQGSVMISSPKGLTEPLQLNLNTLVFNVSTATCSYYCICCYGVLSIFFTPNPAFCLVQEGAALTAYARYSSGNQALTGSATWTSSNTAVATVSGTSGSATVTGVAVGSSTIMLTSTQTAGGRVCGYNPFCGGGSSGFSSSGPANVDSLVFTVASNGVPNDPNGVIAKTAFILKIQAKTAAGVVPDTSFNNQNVPFTLTSMNTTVGEAVSSSTVNFTSGETDPTVTIVQASGLTNSVRQIVVNASATGTVFFPFVYMNVFATDEGNAGQPTACPGYVIPANAQMVALPYGSALCGQQVLVVNGVANQQVPVEDVGPWCPHSVATTSNPCVCSADNYWQGTAIPYAATNSCSSNGAGIDLGDGTYSAVRGGTNGPVDWKFP